MDEFTSLLITDDTRVVVDLLKLSVCNRAGDRGRDVLSAVLSGMGTAYPQVSSGRARTTLAISLLHVGLAFSAREIPLFFTYDVVLNLLIGQQFIGTHLKQSMP